MDLIQLRTKWAETLEEMRKIADRAKAEQRLLTEEEEKRYGELEQLEKDYSANIERLERLEQLEAKRNEPVNKPVDLKVTREDKHDDQGEPRVFRSLGEQLMAVRDAALYPRANHSKLDECQKIMRAISGMNETVAADGGILVEKQFVSGLMDRAEEESKLLPLVRRIPVSANSNGIKFYGVDETSRVDGSRWGGVQAYWEGEGDQYIASKPKLTPQSMTLRKLTGLCYVTEELLEDSTALEAFIRMAFGDEFGFKIDYAILHGTGGGQPKGVFKAESLVVVAKESGQAADTIVLNNLTKMRARLWARSRSRAVWLMNADVEPQLLGLNLSVGNNAYPVFLPATGISGAQYDTLFGRPMLPIEQMETLGDQGDILLWDPEMYMVIDKGGLKAATSIHVRFLFDEVAYKFTMRLDGQPLVSTALTPFKGTATVSPYVTLAARA